MKQMIIADDSSTILEVRYVPYHRYAVKPTRIIRVTGNNLLDALTNMCEVMSFYLDETGIEEAHITPEQIIQRIESENGDDCDFIYYIKDISTGDFLLDWRDTE